MCSAFLIVKVMFVIIVLFSFFYVFLPFWRSDQDDHFNFYPAMLYKYNICYSSSIKGLFQWLPGQRMIVFKTAVVLWKCIQGVASTGTLRASGKCQGRPRLRSASAGSMHLLRLRTLIILSLNTFARRLTAHLFGQCHKHHSATLWYFRNSGAVHVITYLLTYLLGSLA